MAADPQATPGQAAREAFGELGADWYPGTPWNELPRELRAQWDAAAQAVLNDTFPGLKRHLVEAQAKAKDWALKAATACNERDEAQDELHDIHDILVTAYGHEDLSEDTPAVVAGLVAERDSLRIQVTQIQTGHNTLATRNAELAGELDKLRDEREKLLASGNQFIGLINMYVNSLYAVRIDVQRGDPKAVMEALSEGLDGFDGPEWDGTETGAQWWERARGEDGGDPAETAAILADPEAMAAIAEGLSEVEGGRG